MKKMLYTAALTATLSLSLTACQQGYTKEDVDKLTALSERSKQAAIESDLYIIDSTDKYAKNRVYGENIPEIFKSVSLTATQDYAFQYPTQDYLQNYLTFARDLKFECDGSVSYTTDLNVETKVTWDLFITSPRWRVENLSICGKLQIPEGRKLLILVNNSTRLQSIDFSTQRHSVLGLILKNVQYEGAAPILNANPQSIISLEFE